MLKQIVYVAKLQHPEATLPTTWLLHTAVSPSSKVHLAKCWVGARYSHWFAMDGYSANVTSHPVRSKNGEGPSPSVNHHQADAACCALYHLHSALKLASVSVRQLALGNFLQSKTTTATASALTTSDRPWHNSHLLAKLRHRQLCTTPACVGYVIFRCWF